MPMQRIRLVVALAAIVLFGYGMRAGSQNIRYVAIGLLAVAIVLRLAGSRARR